jgi:pimeloyl-ACP methyl ester carboxylesterase
MNTLGPARIGPSPTRVLFLHGGPGLNCQLERERYGDSLPVRWWDQPHFEANQALPFGCLVDAAVEELRQLHAVGNQAVAVVANSFGAAVAMALVERVPEMIGELILLGGIVDIRTALVRLGRRVAQHNCDSSLEKVSEDAHRGIDSASVWVLIDALFKVPTLLDFYWSPTATAQRDATNALAATGTLFHAPTYQSVLGDYLDRMPQSVPWLGPARVLIGRYDPYASSGDGDAWRKLLPNASIHIVEAGHFPHLELPPSVWMPGITASQRASPTPD